MASSMNDDELRKKLLELGQSVGPVTKSTRKLYEKKLHNILQEQKTRRRSLNRSELGHFSSDESEKETNSKSSPDVRRSRRFSRQSIRSDRLSEPSTDQDEDSFAFKVPNSPPSRTLSNSSRSSASTTNHSVSSHIRNSQRLRHSKRNSFDIDSSDSDIDSDYHGRLRKRHVQSEHKIEESVDSSSDIWNTSFNKTDKFHNGNRSEISSGINHLSSKANGYTTDDSTLRNVFKVEDDTVTSTNYSQYISMFLVVVTIFFFIVVGILYVGVKQKDLPPVAEQKSDLICKDEDISNNCIVREAQEIAWNLYNLLTEVAGEYECNEKQSRNLSCETAKSLLIKLEDIEQKKRIDEKSFKSSLMLIMENKDWGIRLYNKDGNENISSVNDIHSLEAVIASKSFFCRLRQAFVQTSVKLLCFVLAILIIIGVVLSIRLYKKKKLLEEKKIFTMVENIIDILKQHNEKCQLNADSEPVLAITHVRDMLIPPSERKSQVHLWERAVKFLEENESRVRVERQHIAGEDYKVWRWLQPNTPEVGGKQGKVWQGQAFGNTGKGMNILPFSPTPCLKIRNMFDPEVEYEDDWQIYIKDAILEKCENNNIVHIQVDTSSNEGCVYLKCLTVEAVGQVYRALHGWWFDSRLITVKYLRLERYHERFPESKYCVTPLKPSNNKRLSLSAPFHSSPLESS